MSRHPCLGCGNLVALDQSWCGGCALTPEEARVIIDAGYDPERILAFLFGEADG